MRIDADAVAAYAEGCAILGTGGGGDIRVPVLIARAALTEQGPIEVVSPDDLPDAALVLPVGGWGAPTVCSEKFDAGTEAQALVEQAEAWFDRPVAALMPSEIGGGNGVTPVAWAAELGLPLVDADAMGRAFPEGDMCAMHIVGLPPAPAFFADERGWSCAVGPVDAVGLEREARAIVERCGGVVAGADHPMDAVTVRTATVRGTVSLAVAIGGALAADGIAGVLGATGGRQLAEGKVVDVERVTSGGFARGVVRIEGTGADAGRALAVDVQNENLRASEEGATIACTPDLIVIADRESGRAIPTERVRYGQRVALLGIPCAAIWRTPRGLEIAGPERFGYPGPWRPVEA